jgi:hypothetical protein
MEQMAPHKSAQISDFIQQRLRKLKLKDVDPVTATEWLIEAGFQEEIGTRPGSYLRSLCRKGLIAGAEKKESKWLIHKLVQRRK